LPAPSCERPHIGRCGSPGRGTTAEGGGAYDCVDDRQPGGGQIMSTYEKVRTFIVVALCGFIPFAWGVLFDGESADRSAGWWVIFLSGVLVIAVGSVVVESLYRNRHTKSPKGESTSRDI
jgi:hypothetical protein